MADGSVKAIELQGIVRNRTKIGVEDGMAEDLINLRFMDGSWRASGDGRLVHTMTGTQYEQLYVHTNGYHHLLGVNPTDNKLYWFANIADDGVTFTALSTPVALTSVSGDIWITQTGHLLTVIDEADDFEYLVFKTDTNTYVTINMDENGDKTSRKLYPFGEVHFNLHSPWRPNKLENFDHAVLIETEDVETGHDDSTHWVKPDVPCDNAKEALGIAAKKNLFVNPFLACAAIKLYDGSYAYASNPVLLYPRQPSSSGERYYNVVTEDYEEFDLDNKRTLGSVYYSTSSQWVGRKYVHWFSELRNEENVTGFYRYPLSGTNPAWNDDTIDDLPSFMAGINEVVQPTIGEPYVTWLTMVLGSDLVCNVKEDLQQLMQQNKDVFSAISIFVTPEVNVYDFDKDKAIPYKRTDSGWNDWAKGDTIFFKRKDTKEIVTELSHQPFFLLKEYNDISELISNPVVDLSEQEALLSNLVQQYRLPIEATSRATYLPKVSYMYNSRLHIANYKTYPFFGYSIDQFHLHNHSVKFDDGYWFKNVLHNISANNDTYNQYEKSDTNLNEAQDLIDAEAPVVIVKVYIDSSQGEQIVSRYIKAYEISDGQKGRADFIEDLNPLLTYPDARAKKMEIYYVNNYEHISGAQEQVFVKWKQFDLKPHPYINIAYYIEPELKPIKLSDFDTYIPEL